MQDQPYRITIESFIFEQVNVFANAFKMYNTENGNQPGEFSNDGSVSCAVKTHGRQAKMTEDKCIVEEYIGKGFCKRTYDQVLALIDAYQQSIAHLIDI